MRLCQTLYKWSGWSLHMAKWMPMRNFHRLQSPNQRLAINPQKKSRKKHSKEEEGPSEMKAEFDAKPKKKGILIYMMLPLLAIINREKC